MAKKSKSKRSLAAKKGWITRRANLRSEAAKKGWITRRANLRKKKKGVKRKVRLTKTEYQVNAKYEPESTSGKVEVQISATGPSGRTREQVIEAVEFKMSKSREGLEGRTSDPPQWELHIIFWEKKGRKFYGEDSTAWNQLSFLFGLMDKEVSGATKKKKSSKVYEEEEGEE